MKNITKQYQDLLEGKMSKDNFMRNVRMEFPQWIAPTNSYQDAINILKSKRILNESIFNTPQMGGILTNWKPTPKVDRIEQDIKGLIAKGNSYEEAIEYIAAEQGVDSEELKAKYPRDVVDIEGHEGSDQEDDEMLAQMASKQDYYDPAYPGRDIEVPADRSSLKENATHQFDRVNYIQLMKGMEFELLKMPEVTDDNLVKAKVKAYKNLVKDPKAYMDLIIANTDAVEKIDKNLRTQEIKKDNLVDKANAMKVIKKDEKANTQTNQSNKEKAKGTPQGVKTMKESVAQRLKENILDEYFEIGEPKKKFAKGEKVVTPEGEVGVIEEMTPDNTAVVKLESGKIVHKQGNVLKPHTEEQVKEYEYGDESDDPMSDEQAAQEVVDILLPNLEDNVYRKQELEDAFRTLEDRLGQHFENEAFQLAIDLLKQQGYTMVFKEDKHAALKEKLVNSLKKEVKTAKTNDAKHNAEVLKKLSTVANSASKNELTADFNAGKTIDL